MVRFRHNNYVDSCNIWNPQMCVLSTKTRNNEIIKEHAINEKQVITRTQESLRLTAISQMSEMIVWDWHKYRYNNLDFKFQNFRNSIWATESWDIFSYDLHVCVKLGMPGLRLAK